jgi:hypothetical protein
MATITKGSFSLNLGLVRLGAELSDLDRQCAWELYTEIATRVAVSGKRSDPECTNFDGELLVESLDSLYNFFGEARRIMRGFPVGRVEANVTDHLGILTSRMLANVLRPFLEKWHVDYRHWWDHVSNPRVPPTVRQNEYPRLKELLADWTAVRSIMRSLQSALVDTYHLVDVDG